MWRDPIVEETRERRQKYASDLNHDMDAIFADIRLRQSMNPKKPIALPARKPNHNSDVA